MGNIFSSAAIWKVIERQISRSSKEGDEWNICAKCGKEDSFDIGGMDDTWFPIPLIPIERGGNKTANNCAIVCPKCYDEIGQDGTKIIKRYELEFIDGR